MVTNPSPGSAPVYGEPSDLADVFNAYCWVMVLASPPRYRTLRREVDRAHLLGLMDVLIAYADRDARYLRSELADPPYALRSSLARAVRDQLAAWKTAELPLELTTAARALLHAEGFRAPEGGWDMLPIAGSEPLSDLLLWPEGIPSLLARGAGQDGAR